MAIPYKERYKLTRPMTSTGPANFYTALRLMAEGRTITGDEIRYAGMVMTYQALREKNLIKFDKKIKAYRATYQGRMYVAVVKSSNSVPKEVLLEIMKAQ